MLSTRKLGTPRCRIFIRVNNGQLICKADEYRANAAECRRMADTKKNVREKHMWRDMSASWLGMVAHAESEEFAARQRESGTRQPNSNSSH